MSGASQFPTAEGHPVYCSIADVATPRPERYLKQLVAHLSTKATATVADERHGTIALPGGQCVLSCRPGQLQLIISASDDAARSALREIIARHLLRFATKEELDIDWALSIRPAGAGDDAELLSLDRSSWTPGSGIPSVSAADRARFFSEHRTPASHLVAEHAGELVGYVCVAPKTALAEAAHVFALWSLVVKESARRHGVASSLLAAAEAVAVRSGAKKISLQVLGSNVVAQRLYQSHGYLTEGRYLKELLINGHYVDDLAMGKELLG